MNEATDTTTGDGHSLLASQLHRRSSLPADLVVGMKNHSLNHSDHSSGSDDTSSPISTAMPLRTRTSIAAASGSTTSSSFQRRRQQRRLSAPCSPSFPSSSYHQQLSHQLLHKEYLLPVREKMHKVQRRIRRFTAPEFSLSPSSLVVYVDPNAKPVLPFRRRRFRRSQSHDETTSSSASTGLGARMSRWETECYPSSSSSTLRNHHHSHDDSCVHQARGNQGHHHHHHAPVQQHHRHHSTESTNISASVQQQQQQQPANTAKAANPPRMPPRMPSRGPSFEFKRHPSLPDLLCSEKGDEHGAPTASTPVHAPLNNNHTVNQPPRMPRRSSMGDFGIIAQQREQEQPCLVLAKGKEITTATTSSRTTLLSASVVGRKVDHNQNNSSLNKTSSHDPPRKPLRRRSDHNLLIPTILKNAQDSCSSDSDCEDDDEEDFASDDPQTGMDDDKQKNDAVYWEWFNKTKTSMAALTGESKERNKNSSHGEDKMTDVAFLWPANLAPLYLPYSSISSSSDHKLDSAAGGRPLTLPSRSSSASSVASWGTDTEDTDTEDSSTVVSHNSANDSTTTNSAMMSSRSGVDRPMLPQRSHSRPPMNSPKAA